MRKEIEKKIMDLKIKRANLIAEFNGDRYNPELLKQEEEIINDIIDLQYELQELKETRYALESTSEEGVFYLVNGWGKHKALWIPKKRFMLDEDAQEMCLFKTKASAKASLTKLLKVMPEYSNDTFEFVTII